METYFKIVEFIEKRDNPTLPCNYRPLNFTPYIYVNVNPVIRGVQIFGLNLFDQRSPGFIGKDNFDVFEVNVYCIAVFQLARGIYIV